MGDKMISYKQYKLLTESFHNRPLGLKTPHNLGLVRDRPGFDVEEGEMRWNMKHMHKYMGDMDDEAMLRKKKDMGGKPGPDDEDEFSDDPDSMGDMDMDNDDMDNDDNDDMDDDEGDDLDVGDDNDLDIDDDEDGDEDGDMSMEKPRPKPSKRPMEAPHDQSAFMDDGDEFSHDEFSDEDDDDDDDDEFSDEDDDDDDDDHVHLDDDDDDDEGPPLGMGGHGMGGHGMKGKMGGKKPMFMMKQESKLPPFMKKGKARDDDDDDDDKPKKGSPFGFKKGEKPAFGKKSAPKEGKKENPFQKKGKGKHKEGCGCKGELPAFMKKKMCSGAKKKKSWGETKKCGKGKMHENALLETLRDYLPPSDSRVDEMNFMRDIARQYGKPVNEKNFNGIYDEDMLLPPTGEDNNLARPGDVGYAPQTRLGAAQMQQVSETLSHINARLRKLERAIERMS